MRLSSKFGFVLVLLTFVVSVSAAGSRLKWRKNVINVGLSTSLVSNGPGIPSRADAGAAFDRSLQTWEAAANITFRRSVSSNQSVDAAGHRGDGISLVTIAQTPENLALFPQGTEDAAARTRVFFDSKGYITEADIVLNPYQQFSADGTFGTFDLQATLTHEIGHLLGLSHSGVFGSTMNENYGRNGLFNLAGFGPRTLSSEDVSAIRTLYGPTNANETCCGKIVGKLLFENGRPASGITVWAEDAGSGMILAEAGTGSDGTFRLDGLTFGKVRLYAQEESKQVGLAAGESLGEVAVEAIPGAFLTKKLVSRRSGLRLDYLGFNGQLAALAVVLNAGNAYTVYLGGQNLDPAKVRLETNSPFIKIDPTSVAKQDFGERLSVLSFAVEVASDTPPGDYSIFAESGIGERRYAIGALTIEGFPNLWTLKILDQ